MIDKLKERTRALTQALAGYKRHEFECKEIYETSKLDTARLQGQLMELENNIGLLEADKEEDSDA